MNMNISMPLIQIPAGLLPDRNAVDSYRALVATAIKEGKQPAPVNIDGLERKTLFLPSLLEAKVKQVAEEHGMTMQQAFAGLATAGVEIVQSTRLKTRTAAKAVDVPFQCQNAHQERFYRNIIASLDAGRVCMAEGSTGIGKSRALIAAAIATAKRGVRPVVIAAPTLAVLGNSLWVEYEALVKEGLGADIRARFFPGASEFVDHNRLFQWLEEAEDMGDPVDSAVLAWANAGGPVIHDGALIRALQSAGFPINWLMNDLRAVATDLNPDDFAYRTGKNEEIALMVKGVRDEAAGADIIFCTHAMLARAQAAGWAWFTHPGAIIVDEDHLFEQNVANVHSQSVSLFSLRHRLRKFRKDADLGANTVAGKTCKAVGELIQVLRGISTGSQTIYLSSDFVEDGFDVNTCDNLITTIKTGLQSRSLSGLPGISDDRAVFAEAVASRADKSKRTYVQFSPDRRFPSIFSGAASVGAYLGAMWRDAAGGVVLASATLYSPDEFGNPKCDYLAGVLAVPPSRLDAPSPENAKFVTDIPVLHIPESEHVPPLCRTLGDKRTEKTEKKWLAHVSKEVASIAAQARGGSLVLCTSYPQINEISKQLEKLGVDPARILAQSSRIKFATMDENFRAAHKNGLRPVMIATGVAWTGVDLRDKETAPEYDTLLTDLVIACVPVGLNRSSTMLTRIQKNSVFPIIKEALMIFRQGLGRLVRSDKATNKNLWVLDGRIWGSWPGMEQFQKSARYLLRQYKIKEAF